MRARADLAVLLWALLSAAGGRAAEPDPPPPIALQPVPHYATEADARAHCPGDVVVWANRTTGFFCSRLLPGYGRGGGSYACLRAAKRADYWNANPFDEEPTSGRVFRIDPSLLGPGV